MRTVNRNIVVRSQIVIRNVRVNVIGCVAVEAGTMRAHAPTASCHPATSQAATMCLFATKARCASQAHCDSGKSKRLHKSSDPKSPAAVSPAAALAAAGYRLSLQGWRKGCTRLQGSNKS